MLRRIYLFLALLSGCALLAQASRAVDAFVASPATDPESVAVAVIDLSDGRTVECYNAAKPLIPASIMKSLTIASLIGETGVDYRYSTKAYTDAPVRHGVIDGNIIIVGSGDPSLGSVKGPESPDFVSEITDALKRKGVTEVTGRIIIDEEVFSGPAVPPSWLAADLRHAYGTGSHGLNYRNNASGGSSVANPAAVFSSALSAALRSAGIELGNGSVEQGERRLLAEHRSATIDEIMRSCMMRSDNLYAESLLRTFSVCKGRPGSTAEAARLETDLWRGRGFDMSGVSIVDGSGLSRQNRLTATFLAEVLREMSGNADYASFFPLAGQEGTLKRFLAGTPLDSYIAMKTGSMSGIQCYAGYKLDDDYAPTHVVVVMANNMRDRGALKRAVEKMLLEIFDNEENE